MTDLSSRRLDIDALRALRAIRQQGGVTRAAEMLGLTQSAVSHKVKRLETSLDCDLLALRPGGPLFTAAGDDLLDYAARILDLHDEALLSLTKTDLSGRIQLGLTEDTTCSDLSRILGRFHRLHPQVAVRTRVRMSIELRALLERGELDAAILQVFAHEVRPTDVALLREGLHWVKLAGLALPERGPIPFLSFDDACFYRHWAMDVGQDDGALLETVFECASAAGIVAGVLAGLGVALLSDRHIRPDMEVIDTRLPPPPGLVYVVRRARRARNPALDCLVAGIVAEVSRQGGLSLVV
ncbi:LysR family transcriptional regulator [Gemmobacter caeruleus]|uniref:LysR family transcriptional regulator n=1 Tax=Gemmobacter caeruleus TaxID=2595004 RepID=UPI0011ECBE9E|nr:LysR family transcriptional regulator [Gemmobacter caeruleus]